MSYPSTVGFLPAYSSPVRGCETVSAYISVESERLDPDALRGFLDIEGCGSVVSFVGITRGNEGDSIVERLEFDHWEKELPLVLERIANTALTELEIYSVVIAHRTGSVLPSEPIVCIHVSSPHSAAGFVACSRIIDELKEQAPLWKKEVRSDGVSWKAGLG